MLSWILFAIPLLVAAGTDPDPKLLEHARTLLERAPFIDTHNDLPTMLVETMHGDLSKLDLNSSSPRSAPISAPPAGRRLRAVLVDLHRRRERQDAHRAA